MFDKWFAIGIHSAARRVALVPRERSDDGLIRPLLRVALDVGVPLRGGGEAERTCLAEPPLRLKQVGVPGVVVGDVAVVDEGLLGCEGHVALSAAVAGELARHLVLDWWWKQRRMDGWISAESRDRSWLALLTVLG